jgi:hypothetical protein
LSRILNLVYFRLTTVRDLTADQAASLPLQGTLLAVACCRHCVSFFCLTFQLTPPRRENASLPSVSRVLGGSFLFSIAGAFLSHLLFLVFWHLVFFQSFSFVPQIYKEICITTCYVAEW